MNPFQFSLEKVLDVRWTAEEEAKNAYAQAQQALFEAEENLFVLKQEKSELMNVPAQGVNRMQVRYWYLIELDRQTLQAENQVWNLKEQVKTMLNKYITAQKDRKILEKLEEKQKEAYDLEFKLYEQKQLDEMSNRSLIMG
ncbi:MAG TPA: flagellar export protein FliJ [Candidatus Enterococcus avicola]|uniref:Flagellar FliJ protein n=1 Tax=Candidatus Enterococcus avicola TaxID=2838561 RepID=A0A9D2JGW9_9ENTE|nr:flagellar export protein FliJ [Candidatus Enterococcus avicola]